jgi:predicted aconitase
MVARGSYGYGYGARLYYRYRPVYGGGRYRCRQSLFQKAQQADLYHIDGLTPEAVEQGESLIADGAKVYVIDDAELDRVKNNYPVMWKDKNATPKLCFVGCPHLSYDQLVEWTENVSEALKKNGRSKVSIPTVFTAAPAVVEKFNATPNAAKLKATGVVLSYICPLMYMNNPLAGKMPVITNSNKLRTYTTSRYYTSAEILDIITKEAK